MDKHGVKKQKATFNLETTSGPEDTWMTLSQKSKENEDVERRKKKHAAKYGDLNARCDEWRKTHKEKIDADEYDELRYGKRGSDLKE